MNVDSALTHRIHTLQKRAMSPAIVDGQNALRRPNYGLAVFLSQLLNKVTAEEHAPLPPEYAMRDYWEPRDDSE